MCKAHSRSIVERMAFNDLVRLSEPKRLVRSNTVTGPPLQIKAGTNGIFYVFNVKSHPSTTGLRHHGYIKFKKPRRVMPMGEVECEVDCDCFAGDAPVLMADGTYKAIKDVVPGDQVYTHKGRVRTVVKLLKRALKPGEKVYEVATTGFPLPFKVTGDHELLVLRGNKLCACGCGQPLSEPYQKSLNPNGVIERRFIKGHFQERSRVKNDIIERVLSDPDQTSQKLVEKYGISKSTVYNIQKGVLKPKDFIPEEQDKFQWVRIDQFRDKEWLLQPWLEEGGSESLDPELARLLGYYAAEGSLLENRNTLRLTFHISEKETLGQDVIDISNSLLNSVLGTRIPQKYLDYERETTRITDNETESFDQVVYVSSELKAYIQAHIGCGSHSKKLSSKFMQLSNETLKEFVVGLFLGDGHVCHRNHNFRWTTVSHSLGWQVSAILHRLRLRHVICFGANNQICLDVCVGDSANRLISWLWSHLRDEVRKKWKNIEEPRPDYNQESGHLRNVCEKTRVEFNDPVFCLEVDNDNSFVVGGCSSINCADFRYTWAWVNKQRGSSRVGPNSLNQAWNKAPRIKNPWNRPGLCKHLLSLRSYLEGQMSNLGFGSPEDADSDVLDKMYARATKVWTDYGAAMAKAREREAKYAARRDVRRAGREPDEVDTVDLPDTVADTEPEETPEVEPETPETERPPDEEEEDRLPPPPPGFESLVDRTDGMKNIKQLIAELADDELFGPDAELPTDEPEIKVPGDEAPEDEDFEDVEGELDDIEGEGEDEVELLIQIRDELRKLNALANPNSNVDAQPVQKLRN